MKISNLGFPNYNELLQSWQDESRRYREAIIQARNNDHDLIEKILRRLQRILSSGTLLPPNLSQSAAATLVQLAWNNTLGQHSLANNGMDVDQL